LNCILDFFDFVWKFIRWFFELSNIFYSEKLSYKICLPCSKRRKSVKMATWSVCTKTQFKRNFTGFRVWSSNDNFASENAKNAYLRCLNLKKIETSFKSCTQKKLFQNSSAADDIQLRKLIWKRIFPLYDKIFSSSNFFFYMIKSHK
jgi:hypothetical protein